MHGCMHAWIHPASRCLDSLAPGPIMFSSKGVPRLSAADEQHLLTCQLGFDACARCKYWKFIEKWTPRVLNVPSDPRKGIWLCEDFAGSSDRGCGGGVGCSTCLLGDVDTPWSRFQITSPSALQICHIMQHADMNTHKQAHAKVYGGPLDEIDNAAPAASVFEDALGHCIKGHPLSTPLADGTQRHKIAQLRWCLHESRRNLWRDALGRAGCIVLHQDGRSPRLLTRFTACDLKLNRVSGCLGAAKHYTPGHVGITNATAELLREFCTLGHGAPPRTHGTSQSCFHHTDLQAWFQKHVEGFDADAASDQQLVGRAMRTQIRGSDAKSIFKNIKIVVKDPTHASRRIHVRTFTHVHANPCSCGCM